MNTLSNFLTICLLLIWSLSVQAETCIKNIDKNTLVIYVPSKQSLYVPSQDKLYNVKTLTESVSNCFNKVAALTQDNTGKLSNLVEWNVDYNNKFQHWMLEIGNEKIVVENMTIYAKKLQNLADTLNDQQQNVNLWPWRVPYSGLSKNLLNWFAELEPDALVLLTADSHRGLSYLNQLSTSTNWQNQYSLKINNQIFANNSKLPLTTLFGKRPLSFEVHWRGENIFTIDTPLDDTEQLSLALWFLPNSGLKSEISLRLQETNALKAPLELIELNTQANQLTFEVRDIRIKPIVHYPDAQLNWTSICPIKSEPAQTWVNYLVNGAQLVCPYLDHQNKVKIELIGKGIEIDTRQLLLTLDFRLDNYHTFAKDWQIEGSLSDLQPKQGVWKILASDLSLGQCSLNFEPISTYAKLAFTSSTVKFPDEICQALYQHKQLGLKPWPKNQQEQIAQSFKIKVIPTPRPLQTHLSKDSLWRQMHWLLNQKDKCQINDNGYFDCEGGNNISFVDLLKGQITLQGFNETIHINNQALLAIYCGDWPRLFPLNHHNIIKGSAKNYSVLDRQTNITRYFNPIGYQQLWSLTGAAVKEADIDGFDKQHDRLFHGIPVSPLQNPSLCNKYSYYQLAISDNVDNSGCVHSRQSDTVHINWVFVKERGEWRGIWDYQARQLANPLANFLASINQEITFHIWFLDVNETDEIGLEEYSRTTVNSHTDSRRIFNRLIQPIQNMRVKYSYANFSQQVPKVLTALAEKQQDGGAYLTILFAHRLSIVHLEQQINQLGLQKQSLIILSRRLPMQSQRDTWSEQGIDFIRLTRDSYWYEKLIKQLKQWNTGE